jgi:DNA-binding transcriptional LysR family regulator
MSLRLQRISEFWRYLPAFRAVAETEHLRRAAEQLHVSPSALSRTVQLVEEAVGVPLFHRQGRGIQLTRAGQTLLLSVRTAMRIVDEGLVAATEDVLSGSARVGVCVRSQGLVSRALARLRRDHPRLLPIVRVVDATQVPTQLRLGALDVAFVPVPVTGDDLQVVPLAPIPSVVLCPDGHALAGVSNVELADLSSAFVAPAPTLGGPADGWPAHVARNVVLHVDDPILAGALAAEEGLLVIVPEALLPMSGLARVDASIPAVPMYAVRRVSVSAAPNRADLVIDAVAEALAAVRTT